MISKRYWTGLLVAFVLLDILLTFWQAYQLPLDGDLMGVVVPAPFYSKVLHDPFGWGVVARNETYAATNRFFAHATMWQYWRWMPHLLQYITNPINSLYASSALFNTIAQTLLILILGAYIRLGAGLDRGDWGYWVAVALVVPLFQTYGFYEQIGIINWAITYTFFYAFPAGLLLLLMLPFYRAAYYGQPLHLRTWQVVLLILLMVVVVFNGPVVVATVAVLMMGIGIYWAWRQWQATTARLTPRTITYGWLSKQALALLALLASLSIYSLYVGRNNAENTHTHTLAELYALLPTGFSNELQLNWGLPLLLLFIVVNSQLINHFVTPSVQRQRVLVIVRWVTAFSVVFILLLPFGGYRIYRPYLIRGDSVMPVLLGLFYAYGVTTCFLLFQLRGRMRSGYLAAVLLFASVFIYEDLVFKMPNNNDCERWALDQIARAPEPVVRLAPFCNVLSWDLIRDYNYSDLNAEMLQYWGVTEEKKLYYHQ